MEEKRYCIHCLNLIQGHSCLNCGGTSDFSAPNHHLAHGTILNKKYYVGKSLGEGGFGITYNGLDLNLNLKIAIKEYYPNGYVSRSNTISPCIEIANSERTREFVDKSCRQFINEARSLAKFTNEPGIVGVRDYFEENNTAYIVMDYLEGMTLKEHLTNKHVLSIDETLRLIAPVMQSLMAIHKAGVIHRDISPDNIMIVGNNTKLLDFGAARDISKDRSLSVMLKEGYAPEEQYRSKGNQGPWTDVYSLSATIYKCITGRTPDASIQRMYHDELKTPSELGVAISPVMESALLKGLAVLQSNRYQTIEELLDGLNGKTVVETVPIAEFDCEKTVLGTAMSINAGISVEPVGSAMSDNTIMNMPIAILTPNNISVNASVSDTINSNAKPFTQPVVQAVPPSVQPQPSTVDTPVPPKKEKQRKPKRKKNLAKVLGGAAAAIFAAVVVFVVFSSLGSVTIGEQTFSKDETTLYLYNDTLTSTDIKSLSSFNELEYIKFSGCEFEGDAELYLNNIAASCSVVILSSCTGIDDFSAISELEYITAISITDCGVTNDDLVAMNLADKNYLTEIYLTDNSELSDISCLSSMETLLTVDVSYTAVKDFSALANSEYLSGLGASGNELTDISSIQNTNIQILSLTENNIEDISVCANMEYLNDLDLSFNNISDIIALSGSEYLQNLNLSYNAISDLSALSALKYLITVDLRDNSISDVSPLANKDNLSYLYLNNNQLSSIENLNLPDLKVLYVQNNELVNLDGLEQSIYLTTVYAQNNALENIDGLTNTTILKYVNLNNNQISDISVLSKSAATLLVLCFNNNLVTDISALENTSTLTTLSFDDNSVTNLDALSSSVNLTVISAENNGLTSISGLSNSLLLKYIYLAYNEISDISALSNITGEDTTLGVMVDLRNNNIDTLLFSEVCEYWYFAVSGNPISNFANIENVFSAPVASYFLITYNESLDYTQLSGCSFKYIQIVDCPLDQQITVDNQITNLCDFSTSEEVDATIDTKKREAFNVYDSD